MPRGNKVHHGRNIGKGKEKGGSKERGRWEGEMTIYGVKIYMYSGLFPSTVQLTKANIPQSNPVLCCWKSLALSGGMFGENLFKCVLWCSCRYEFKQSYIHTAVVTHEYPVAVRDSFTDMDVFWMSSGAANTCSKNSGGPGFYMHMFLGVLDEIRRQCGRWLNRRRIHKELKALKEFFICSTFMSFIASAFVLLDVLSACCFVLAIKILFFYEWWNVEVWSLWLSSQRVCVMSSGYCKKLICFNAFVLHIRFNNYLLTTNDEGKVNVNADSEHMHVISVYIPKIQCLEWNE
jgi:hypothetical protein